MNKPDGDDNRKSRGRIVARELAAADHAVASVMGGGGQYRREPCGGCPWRVDNTGKFPAQAFRLSANTAYDASLEMFGCHESGGARPATCAGFLLRNSVHNLATRIGLREANTVVLPRRLLDPFMFFVEIKEGDLPWRQLTAGEINITMHGTYLRPDGTLRDRNNKMLARRPMR